MGGSQNHHDLFAHEKCQQFKMPTTLNAHDWKNFRFRSLIGDEARGCSLPKPSIPGASLRSSKEAMSYKTVPTQKVTPGDKNPTVNLHHEGKNDSLIKNNSFRIGVWDSTSLFRIRQS